MKRFMTYATNHKGITLVLMAIMLIFLLIFASLAIDIAYMYFAKNQLQVAADAAALAGAAKIVDPTVDPTPTQIEARQAAWKFACKNKAGGLTNISGSVNFSHNNVYLANNSDDGSCSVVPAVSNLNPGNDATGDIVLGNWNSNRFLPTDCRFLPSSDPSCPSFSSGINAAKVVANRTGAGAVDNIRSGNNPVNVFLGQIFRMIGTDWSFMSAAASAIAARPPRADAYFDVCWNETNGACRDPISGRYCSVSSPCTFSSRALCTTPKPGSGGELDQSMGWTSLTTNCSSNSISDDLVCSDQPAVNVCPGPICVQNGTTSTPKDLEALMYDPLYDSVNKTCLTADGKCHGSSDTVNGWWVIVPVTATCPASVNTGTMYPVYGYARLHLTAVCGSGGGLGGACDNHKYQAPVGTCYSDPICGPNHLQFDSIACVDCANMDEMLGLKTVLVK